MSAKGGFNIGPLYVSHSTQYWIGNGLLGLFAFFGWVAGPVAFGGMLAQKSGSQQGVSYTADVYWNYVHTSAPAQNLQVAPGVVYPFPGCSADATWSEQAAQGACTLGQSLPTCEKGMPAFIAFYALSFVALTLFAAAAAVRQFVPRFHSVAYKSQTGLVIAALVCQIIALPIAGACLHETGLTGIDFTGGSYLIFAIITLGLIAVPLAVLTLFLPQLQSRQAAAPAAEGDATKQISVVAGEQPKPSAPAEPELVAPEAVA